MSDIVVMMRARQYVKSLQEHELEEWLFNVLNVSKSSFYLK